MVSALPSSCGRFSPREYEVNRDHTQTQDFWEREPRDCFEKLSRRSDHQISLTPHWLVQTKVTTFNQSLIHMGKRDCQTRWQLHLGGPRNWVGGHPDVCCRNLPRTHFTSGSSLLFLDPCTSVYVNMTHSLLPHPPLKAWDFLWAAALGVWPFLPLLRWPDQSPLGQGKLPLWKQVPGGSKLLKAPVLH